MSRRLAVFAATMTALGGCFYDGAYVIKGRVSAERAASGTPIPGATVVTRYGNDGPRQAATTTAADGSYELNYGFGGMGLLFFVPDDGDPHVEFSAPGYASRVVRLRGAPACAPSDEPRCFNLDAVLTPEAAPSASPEP